MRKEGEARHRLKDLRGFALSPNQATDYLEQYLGIEFTDKPSYIKSNFRNNLIYVFKEGPIGAIILAIYNKIWGVSDNRYDARYNAVFVKNQSLICALHENMHAFTQSVNPELFPAQADLLFDSLPPLSPKKVVNKSDIENALVYQCFIEGVAVWGALETASCLPTTQALAEEITQEKQYLIGRYDGYINTQFMSVKAAVASYRNASQQTKIKNIIRYIRLAEAFMQKAEHVTGYYFMNEAMMNLRNRGMTANDALVTLINNPPSTIFELRNPLGFLDSLTPLI